MTQRVAIATNCSGYPVHPPYPPGDAYPECQPFGAPRNGSSNDAYGAVRLALQLLGLDERHAGGPDWNPLRRIVHPGDTVVLKPNFVRNFRENSPDHADCLITHGSVIRAVLDYVYLALDGRGRIIIADAPHNDADFEAIRTIAGLAEICEDYRRHRKFELEVYDLRPEQAHKIDGIIVGHSPLPGDPAGYVRVNLGRRSAFADINHLCHLLYGAEYDTKELYSHQHDDVHEYLISKTVLDADVVISIPKLKTHKKVGLTVNMKNLVGINGNKNWLPHHREGTPAQGGDQFRHNGFMQRLERAGVMQFKRLFPLLGPIRSLVAGPIKAVGKRVFGDTDKDTIRSGNWYGNDTTWRMALDLNRILMYTDADGVIQTKPQRKLLNLVDGIVAGEGNGPMDATPKEAGAIVAGFNPVAVELVCARLMGFDYLKIPMLCNALDTDRALRLVGFGYDEIECLSDREDYQGVLKEFRGECFGFEAHFGWKGHIELTRRHGGTEI
ncbi:MAG: DUF362 domain-containing protein [Planctomycetes bacterium]|nr:DUF362 domain-containing protein [Planctomycetota bacterium]